MSKELSPLGMWEKVKEYIEFCTGVRDGCEAMVWTSTYYFLKPFMDGIETALKEHEEDKKLLNEQAKANRYLMEQIKQSQKQLKALKIIKKNLFIDFEDERRTILLKEFEDQECDYTIIFCNNQEEYELLKEELL